MNMKHIKHYKIFESNEPNFPTTREGVIEVCEECGIENYTINDDLSISVEDIIDLSHTGLEYIPLRFNYVSGYFNCSYNKLKTLEGCPEKVGGTFNCSFNQLKTLKGCPQTVDGYFICYRNELKTLEFSPQTVGGHFNCSFNDIETLRGCPLVVNANFLCDDNELKDLDYFPEVSGGIYIQDNPVCLLIYTFIYKRETDSFLIEDFVDYEIVRNRDTVMLDRLQTFIRDNDLEMPDLEDIKKHYKIIE